MNRIYTDTSHFRSPYASVMFAGLGQSWPQGRSYQDISNYRAPYDSGYFQNNTLFGLGYDPAPPGVDVPPPQAARTTPTWVLVGGGLLAVAAMVGVAVLVSKKAPGMDRGGGVGF